MTDEDCRFPSKRVCGILCVSWILISECVCHGFYYDLGRKTPPPEGHKVGHGRRLVLPMLIT